MNRIGFYNEDGELKMELEEVTPVTEDDVKGKFVINDRPAYLKIFFMRPLDEEELFDIYGVLIEYHVINMTRKEMDAAIQEDLNHQPMGSYEFKCDFHDALLCAQRFGQDILFREDAIAIQVSDEPSENMKKWLLRKEGR